MAGENGKVLIRMVDGFPRLSFEDVNRALEEDTTDSFVDASPDECTSI